MAAGIVGDHFFVCAFQGILSPDREKREQAEVSLKQIESIPGILLQLVDFIPKSGVDVSLRTCAAVYLKNAIRERWDRPVFGTAENKEAATVPIVSREEKAAIRQGLLSLLELTLLWEETSVRDSASSLEGIRPSVLESLRVVTLCDFPEEWPELFPWVTERLQQRERLCSARGALLLLRLMARKFEFRAPDDLSHLTSLVSGSFPLLLALGEKQAVSWEGHNDGSNTAVMDNEQSAEMVKLICKIYWSCTQMALAESDEVINSLGLWMELMKHVIQSSVSNETVASWNPRLMSSSAERERLQCFKAKRWAICIVGRLSARYARPALLDYKNSENKLGKLFFNQWCPVFVEQFVSVILEEQRAMRVQGLRVSQSPRMTDSILSRMLEYLSECLERSTLYKPMKPHMSALLFDVCFPLLCLSTEDLELWQTDPVDFIRSQSLSFGSFRDAVTQFVQNAVRYRGRDLLQPTYCYAETILNRYRDAPTIETRRALSLEKDGALFMLGAISDRLVSRKRKGFDRDAFLAHHVLPELSNTDLPILRLRACWAYERFLDAEGAVDGTSRPELLVKAFTDILNLCLDSELPVRVAAATSLQAFAELKDEQIHAFIEERIPVVLERLFRVMREVQDNEGIVLTLEKFVLNFEARIQPFAVELVSNLASALKGMIVGAWGEEADEGDDGRDPDENDNTVLTIMNIGDAIVSVMATVAQPQFSELFTRMAEDLVSLLDILLSPEGDLFSDGLVILRYLTLFCTSLSAPTDLWRYFERMYQAVCGGSTPHLPLEGMLEHGWAPDYVGSMISCLRNYVSRDPQRFTTGQCAALGLTYKEMLLKIVEKSITLSDVEEGRYGIRLMTVVFESFIEQPSGIQDMVHPCLKLLFAFLRRAADEAGEDQQEGTACQDKRLASWKAFPAVRLLSSMLLCHGGGVLKAIEDTQLTGMVTDLWLNYAHIGRHLSGKKCVVLATALLIREGAAGRSWLHAHLPQLSASLARQVDAYIRQKAEGDGEEGSDDEYDTQSVDSEQDIGEDEDASIALPERVLRSLRTQGDAGSWVSEDGDTDDESETFDGYSMESEERHPAHEGPLDKIEVVHHMMNFVSEQEALLTASLGHEPFGALKNALVKEMEKSAAKNDRTNIVQ